MTTLIPTATMDFLRGRLLRRSPATWSKEGDGGRGYSAMHQESPRSRRGSSTSSWLRERASGTSSWGKEGTSVSSWREGSSVCPPYTSPSSYPKSSYSKSEQSWRLPRLRASLRNQDLKFQFPSKVLTVTMEIISCYHKVADAYKVIFLDNFLIFTFCLFRRDSYSFQSPTPTR